MAATAPPVGAPGVPKPEPDASGTFSQAKREAGLLRIQQAGVVVSDYATLMVEALADNAAPESGAVYAALDVPFAVLVGQISAAYQA
ncbi:MULTISPECIES: hypothetical protein [Streptomyces]|uniref:hypothetical protein n=1 Tax=Streptomyces TaxID=1883 RepID=UPI0029B62455|nr:hypothetical protein [Streptomyces sp. AK02-04a]MDX3759149.1 hypothetical protein [Streptomyces sp. AK02-04a]